MSSSDEELAALTADAPKTGLGRTRRAAYIAVAVGVFALVGLVGFVATRAATSIVSESAINLDTDIAELKPAVRCPLQTWQEIRTIAVTSNNAYKPYKKGSLCYQGDNQGAGAVMVVDPCDPGNPRINHRGWWCVPNTQTVVTFPWAHDYSVDGSVAFPGWAKNQHPVRAIKPSMAIYCAPCEHSYSNKKGWCDPTKKPGTPCVGNTVCTPCCPTCDSLKDNGWMCQNNERKVCLNKNSFAVVNAAWVKKNRKPPAVGSTVFGEVQKKDHFWKFFFSVVAVVAEVGAAVAAQAALAVVTAGAGTLLEGAMSAFEVSYEVADDAEAADAMVSLETDATDIVGDSMKATDDLEDTVEACGGGGRRLLGAGQGTCPFPQAAGDDLPEDTEPPDTDKLRLNTQAKGDDPAQDDVEAETADSEPFPRYKYIGESQEEYNERMKLYDHLTEDRPYVQPPAL